MYVTRLKLENIRAFADVDLTFADPGGQPRMRTVIIGKNGTCKSSLLRCIALGLSDTSQANGLLREDIGQLVGSTNESGTIAIELVDKAGDAHNLRRTIKRNGASEFLFDDTEAAAKLSELKPFVCGYGPGRTRPYGYDTGRPYNIDDSTYSLFNYDQPLIGPELILRRLKEYFDTKEAPEEYERVLSSIKSALHMSPDDLIWVEPTGGVFVSGRSIGERVPLQGWADGYRFALSLILDVFAWALRAEALSADTAVEGILLVDEVDQHLHPELQISLVPELQELFRSMQLIATTHSPVTTLGVGHGEVIALRRDGEHVVERKWLPPQADYTYEDVLADPNMFGVPPYSPATREKLARWEVLSDKPEAARTADEVQELSSLARELRAVGPERPNALREELQRLREQYDL